MRMQQTHNVNPQMCDNAALQNSHNEQELDRATYLICYRLYKWETYDIQTTEWSICSHGF